MVIPLSSSSERHIPFPKLRRNTESKNRCNVQRPLSECSPDRGHAHR